jgi:pimeloyl-ACP methyl ester carboxylesterase
MGRRVMSAAMMLIAALPLAGCGATPRAHPRPPAAIDGCLLPGREVRPLELRRANGPTPIPAVLVGRGRTAFVLTNESDENLCSWLAFTRTLRAHSYAVLLYDYSDPSSLPAEVIAAVRAVRSAGIPRVVLAGASVGARASIEAAASHPAGVVAVVSLSAEQTVRSDPTDLAQVAHRVRLPTLVISARDDPYVAGFTPTLLRALATRDKNALILAGSDHGTAVLTSGDGSRVTATILGFVRGVPQSDRPGQQQQANTGR